MVFSGRQQTTSTAFLSGDGRHSGPWPSGGYCVYHGIVHPEIDAFLEHCLALAGTRDIVAWEQDRPLLTSVGLGEGLPEDLRGGVGTGRAAAFEWLTQQVTEIGYADLYGAVTEASKRHLRAAFAVLEADGISLPESGPFQVSPFAEVGSWGEPVAPKIVAEWRALL